MVIAANGKTAGQQRLDHFESALKSSNQSAVEAQLRNELKLDSPLDAPLKDARFSAVGKKAAPRRQRRCWQ